MTVLCDMLVSVREKEVEASLVKLSSLLLQPTAELVSECWRNEQELFCFQWKLRQLLNKAARELNPGIRPDRIQWIRNELSHIPDSDAKDYICLHHSSLSTTGCKELL